MQETFNRHRRAVHRTFQPGDKIYFMDYTTAKRSWSPGEVMERCGTVMYKIKNNNKIHRRHANQLRPLAATENCRSIPFDMIVDLFDVDVPEPPEENTISEPVPTERRYPTRNRAQPRYLEVTHKSHHGRYRSFSRSDAT